MQAYPQEGTQVSSQSQHFMNTHFPNINHCFSTQNSSYHITKESIISPNGEGSYHTLHVLGNQDHKLYTVTFLSKNGHAHLFQYGMGYLPHQLGYGTLFQSPVHEKAERHEHHPSHQN